MSTDANTGPETGSQGNDSKVDGAAADAAKISLVSGGDQAAKVDAPAPLTGHWSALDAGSQDIVRKNGWADKGTDEVLKAYDALSQKLGTAIQPPAADATPEQVAEFYNKLGRPADSTKYSLPEDTTKRPGYSQDMTEAFKVKGHEIGLTQKQFEEIAKWSIETGSKAIEGEARTIAERGDKAVSFLEKDWGKPGDTSFKKEVDYAKAGINGLDPELMAELQEIGAVGPEGEILAPKTVRAFAKVGKKLFSEDASVGRHDAITVNPFDPKTMDIELAGRLVREAKLDKTGAKREVVVGLMKQHGVNPASYQL